MGSTSDIQTDFMKYSPAAMNDPYFSLFQTPFSWSLEPFYSPCLGRAVFGLHLFGADVKHCLPPYQ
jgi:hypothetical protein